MSECPASDKLRWGILCVANINNRFLPPVLKSSRSVLVAVGSRSLEKAKAHAEKWRIPKYYGSYEELIGDGEINAVYIPLPIAFHVEWTLKVAGHGLHCLVEKPISQNGDGVRKLQAVSRENSVVIEEAFVHLHHPLLRAVRDEMKTIGQISNLFGSFQVDMTDGHQPLVYNADLGSGAIWMLGAYPISAFIFLLNQRPVSICAQYKQHPTGVDETLSAIIKFPNGVIATASCSITAMTDTMLEICGDKGVIRLSRDWCYHVGRVARNNKFEVIRHGESRTVTVSDEEAFAMQLQRFEQTVLDGKAPDVSLELSEWIAETLDACVRSAKEEKFVHL